MPPEIPAPVSHKNIYLIAAVAAVLLVIGLAYASYSYRMVESTMPVQDQEVTEASAYAPASADTDTFDSAESDVDAAGAANPFNDTSTSADTSVDSNYQNPF